MVSFRLCHLSFITLLAVTSVGSRGMPTVVGFSPSRHYPLGPLALVSLNKKSFFKHEHRPTNAQLQSRARSPLPLTLPSPRRNVALMALSPVTWCTFGATWTLAVSTCAGFWFEKRILANSGIPITLSVSALASNLLGSVPNVHPLYDYCWSTVLPASLAFLLLSLETTDRTDRTVCTVDNETERPAGRSTWIGIRRMALPFAIASIGSVLGCLASFAISLRFSSFLLPPLAACQAAACLAASFIGGSVNFFATAAMIIGKDSPSGHALISAMAAADIIVMAMYFALLAAALRSKTLQRWFRECDGQEVLATTEAHVNHNVGDRNKVPLDAEMTNHANFSRQLIAAIMVSMLAFGLVELAKRFERVLDNIVPGTACAFLAAAIPSLTRLVPPNNTRWSEMQAIAGPCSTFSFLSLFAAIGVSVNLGQALGSGPACLFFSTIALAVHGLVTLGGSVLVHKARRNNKISSSSSSSSNNNSNNNISSSRDNQSRLRLANVLTASNAAIGGPATAAAFCGQVTGIGSGEKRGLTVAATVWGVVGYAIGTTIGVALYRLLQAKFVL